MTDEPLASPDLGPPVTPQATPHASAEREQFSRQIDLALEQERRSRQAGSDLLAVRAHSRGALLPLLVNLAALVLLAAGVLLLLRYFRVREEGITLRAGTYLSAEGRLLQALRQETDQRLRAKDAEIAVIQQRLRELGEQGTALQARVDQELAAREQALRRDMEDRLAAERERLASLGTSAAGIDRRLGELQRQGQRDMGTEIDSYRRMLEEQLAGQTAALREAREQAEAALAQAGRERRAVLEEMDRREAELRARFEQERQALRTEARGAEDRAREAEQALRTLTERMQAQELLEDQVNAHYLRALQALEGRDSGEALDALGALQALLQARPASALPGLAARREVDARLIAALRVLALSGRQASGTAPADARRAEQAGLEAELERTRAELAQREGEVADLERRLRLAAQSTGAEARSAGAAQRELQTRVQRLEDELQAGEERAARLALQLDGARAEKAAAERSMGAAREEGLSAGREAALKDVMRYLSYASGSPEERKALEGALLALVREDPLYRAVTREIQLATSGGAGGERGAWVFLGVVASVSGPTIVVEPMVEVTAVAGSLIQLRRPAELEREQTIGGGKVLQVRGGRITALVEAGVSAPAPHDLVYVERRQ